MTPLGIVWIASSPQGVFRISLRCQHEAEFVAGLRGPWGIPGVQVRKDAAAVAGPALELREYFEGARRRFNIPVDLTGASPFRRRVLKATAKIPFGEVASYGAIASAIRQPGASRAVGNALGANPIPILIPCHRVVASDGTIGGFTGGTELKRKLLAVEGIPL